MPIGEALLNAEITGYQVSQKVSSILLNSWAPATKKQYQSPISKWFQFCHQNNISPYNASFEDGAEFLADEFLNSSKGYSAMNTARSALSAILKPIDGFTFGKHPMICRLLKGMFRMRPSLPKYVVTYDAAIVLNYLADLPVDNDLDLPTLTYKVATLILFLSGKRSQVMEFLMLECMYLDNNKAVFYISELMKETRPAFHTDPLQFMSFPYNLNLCTVTCLSNYLDRTGMFRKDLHKGHLFLSPFSPHSPVKNATIARYVRSILFSAGIPLTVFGVHSTRSSSTSKAESRHLSLSEIYKAAGWAGAGTFQKHYKKPIVCSFDMAVLDEFK